MNSELEQYRLKDRQIAHYFDTSRTPTATGSSSLSLGMIEEGLQEMSFGEFLAQEKLITRDQLLVALQLQDQRPQQRIGQCIAALGYLPYAEVQRSLTRWNNLDVVLV